MSRRLAKTLALTTGLVLVLCASAFALRGEIGNTVVSSTATVTPRELPASGGASITLQSVTRIRNKDGTPPQVLSSIDFVVDKHGYLETKGVPVCTVAKLGGTTSSQARKRCAGALVGTGTVKALVNLPGQPQTTMTSPVSFFNGPKQGGRPTLVGHTYETLPAPKALLVEVPVRRVSKGRYGFAVEVALPRLAEGYGTPVLAEATVGRTWRKRGREVGYLTAHCSGGRLQVKGKLNFANGDIFPALFSSPCRVPR